MVGMVDMVEMVGMVDMVDRRIAIRKVEIELIFVLSH